MASFKFKKIKLRGYFGKLCFGLLLTFLAIYYFFKDLLVALSVTSVFYIFYDQLNKISVSKKFKTRMLKNEISYNKNGLIDQKVFTKMK